jgi:membrane associated rhomboid family serine protease
MNDEELFNLVGVLVIVLGSLFTIIGTKEYAIGAFGILFILLGCCFLLKSESIMQSEGN